MKSFPFLRPGLVFPCVLLLASSLNLRAADQTPAPSAPPPPAVQKPETPPPAPAPAAVEPVAPPAVAPATPAVAAPVAPAAVQPEPSPAPGETAEAAQRLAEKAGAEAERIAAQAQANAEKIADQARAEAERIADQARAEAEKAGDKARAHAEEIAEKAQAEAARVQANADQPDEKSGKPPFRYHSTRNSADDRVMVMNDNVIAAGEKVAGAAVAVMGNLTMDGEANSDAVAVMGDNTINGAVHGNAVAVMGTLTLGPKAVVDGDAVCVGGQINRDPAAVVHGHIQEVQPFGPKFKMDPLANWWTHGLKLGRPLAIGAHLGWLWIITAFSVAFYALLGLIFPNKIRSCGDKLMQEPGLAILAGVLGILALPVLFVLLLITIIGIPVALLVLPVGIILVMLFGKASIYGLVGRRLTGDRWHPSLAIILGALVFVLLYLVPIVGLLLSLLVGFLGFGCVVLSIFSRSPKPAAVPAAAAPAVPPVLPVAAAGLAAPLAAATVAAPAETAGMAPTLLEAAVPAPAAPAPAPVVPVPAVAPAPAPLTADTLPRAGFWIRVAAAFLDFMIICVPAGMLGLFRFGPGMPGMLFLLLAAYHVAMWKHKGTTIGGIICHLKVVRLDDRPIDWGVAVVRSLTAFLSFMVMGLGFIWVAFDDDKQSWHDKVAGTTIVRVPKGTPLL